MKRSLLLAACLLAFTNANALEVTGMTAANKQLFPDTMRGGVVPLWPGSKTCRKIDSVHTSVVSDQTKTQKKSSDASPLDTPNIELWTVSACGTEVKYKITFAGDGNGGTTYSMSTVKP